jgi:hypothetical protein
LIFAGPLAARLGSAHTLLWFAAIFFVSLTLMLSVPSVWRLKATVVEPTEAV